MTPTPCLGPQPVILFIPPGTALSNAWPSAQLPVGLLLLATVAREAVDAQVRLYTGPLYFPDGGHALADALLALGPALVGFSTWCHTYPAQLTLAAALKAKAPTLPILFGGPQATATDLLTLETCPQVDFVLRGEAEVGFRALLLALKDGGPLSEVPGLSYREAGRPRRSAVEPARLPLAALPKPALDLRPPHPVALVESARGCPYRCRFCAAHLQFPKRRLRPLPALVEEVLALKASGVRHLTFTDDAFTANRAHVQALCQALMGLGLSWSCTARADAVDEALLAEMAASGCEAVLFGVESGSAEVLSIQGKRLELSALWQGVERCLAAGIAAHASFILGFPEESPEALAETLALALALAARGVAVHAQCLAVLPGTALAAEHGGELRFDGFSTLSHATLTPAERAAVEANPALFSSFFYLPSPAASRDQLISRVQLLNLLRQLPRTLAWVGWCAPDGPPFSWLDGWLEGGRLPQLKGRFEEDALPLLAEALAHDPEASALLAFERALLGARNAALVPLPAQPCSEKRTTCSEECWDESREGPSRPAAQTGLRLARPGFFFAAPYTPESLVRGRPVAASPSPAFFALDADGAPAPVAILPEVFAALTAVPEGASRAQAVAALALSLADPEAALGGLLEAGVLAL